MKFLLNFLDHKDLYLTARSEAKFLHKSEYWPLAFWWDQFSDWSSQSWFPVLQLGGWTRLEQLAAAVPMHHNSVRFPSHPVHMIHILVCELRTAKKTKCEKWKRWVLEWNVTRLQSNLGKNNDRKSGVFEISHGHKRANERCEMSGIEIENEQNVKRWDSRF